MGDEYRSRLRSGAIHAYLILRNYDHESCRVGETLRLNIFSSKGEQLQCVAKATVIKARFCKLMQITYPELQAAGFKSMTEAVECLQTVYQNIINPDTDMIVVTWKNLIPQGLDEQ